MPTTATHASFQTFTAEGSGVCVDLLASGWSESAATLAIAQGCSCLFIFGTEAERDAFVALFPKMVGLHKIKVTIGWEGDTRLPGASFGVNTRRTGVTGTLNETGLKRLTRLASILATVFPAR